MAYGGFKDLTKRIASDKISPNKAFNITKNPKYDRHQGRLASIFYTFFDKKLLLEQLKMKSYLIKNQQKNYTNQLLEYLKNEEYTHLFYTIFGVLKQLICNY